MGCLSSKSAKDGKPAQKSTTVAKPIAIERQKEAQVHFGMRRHRVIRALGKGGTGETYLCVRKDTNEEEAVKVIKRPIPKVLKDMIANEILIQASLGEGHFNLVNAHEVLLTDTHLCLMLEYASGGTLTDYVSARYDTVDQRGGLFLGEGEARYLFQQCIDAVDYCHQHNIAHRDLKLDNTLLDSNNPPYIKICDFGFAKMMGGAGCHTMIGTPVYMSPQVIEKRQQGYDGRASDVWACGVLLFVMLLGAFPFEHQTQGGDEQRAFNEVHYEQIRMHWTDNPRNKEVVARMSNECRDLLDRIFELDEKQRITIAGIREHPWYTRPLEEPYASAMARLKERQAAIDRETKLLRESGAGIKEASIKGLVESACRPPGTGDTTHGEEIVLKRTGRLSTLLEDQQLHGVKPEDIKVTAVY